MMKKGCIIQKETLVLFQDQIEVIFIVDGHVKVASLVSLSVVFMGSTVMHSISFFPQNRVQ